MMTYGQKNVILYLNKKDYKVNSREKMNSKKFKIFFGHTNMNSNLGWSNFKRKKRSTLKKHCNWKVSFGKYFLILILFNCTPNVEVHDDC